jgi:hypothetical protein
MQNQRNLVLVRRRNWVHTLIVRGVVRKLPRLRHLWISSSHIRVRAVLLAFLLGEIHSEAHIVRVSCRHLNRVKER